MNEVVENRVSAVFRPAVGVGVVIMREGVRGQEVILIRRGRAPRLGEWSIPGGHQELGETVRETGIREAREETGLEVGNLRLVDVVDLVRKGPDGAIDGHWTLIDFRADYVRGEPRAGDDADEVRWVPLDAIDGYSLWDETVRIIRAAAVL